MRDKFERWFAGDVQKIMPGSVAEKAETLKQARDGNDRYSSMFFSATAAWQAYQRSRIHKVQEDAEEASEGTGEVLAVLEITRVPKGGVRATVTREKRQNHVILDEYYVAIGYEEGNAVNRAQEASGQLGWTIEVSEDEQEGEESE